MRKVDRIVAGNGKNSFNHIEGLYLRLLETLSELDVSICHHIEAVGNIQEDENIHGGDVNIHGDPNTHAGDHSTAAVFYLEADLVR